MLQSYKFYFAIIKEKKEKLIFETHASLNIIPR